jgi:hypothetical protein
VLQMTAATPLTDRYVAELTKQFPSPGTQIHVSAKQAYARLLQSLERNRRGVSQLLEVRAGGYQTSFLRKTSQRLLAITGWEFEYLDGDASHKVANVESNGKVTHGPGTRSGSWQERGLSPFNPGTWLIDFDEAIIASQVVSENNAKWEFPKLRTQIVSGEGLRPVWGVGAGGNGQTLLVDAETGTIYRSLAFVIDGEAHQLAPTDTESQKWRRSILDRTKDTSLLREDLQYLPLAVRVEAHLIYNNELLQKALRDNLTEKSRNSSSLLFAGVLKATQGDWSGALQDLGEAKRLDPKNRAARLYRGLCLLAIRDLDGAGEELRSLDNTLANKTLQTLKDRKSSDIGATLFEIRTPVGTLPFEVNLNPLPNGKLP